MSLKMKRTLWCWLALSPLIVLVLFPFAIMLFTALKPADEVFVYPARWLPVHWQWHNFVDMWDAANFGVALRNSVVVSLLSMAPRHAESLVGSGRAWANRASNARAKAVESGVAWPTRGRTSA